ncbi:hypothetical protein ACFO3J_22770 [Streptomyces polygonati]|uniref:Uncharacterized protein n=1 Tax=Streptomyces polygonati TaxID=1617087 RepID=A0ABV8HTI3_9ACTN
MEQRIGSTSPPVPPAGIDPAFIPGLTPPPPAEGLDARTEPTADIPPEVPETTLTKGKSAPRGTSAGAVPPGTADSADAADGARLSVDEPDAEDESDDIEQEDGLPTFEATDRRGAIIADRSGVVFRLDDQEAEFGWDEIGAVEIDTPRFGRRFSVTVYTSTRRWFQADVDAPSRSVLKQWTTELEAVLDARFEDDGAKEEAEPETADSVAAEEAESEAETPADARTDDVADDAADAKTDATTGTEPDTDAKTGAESKA